MPKSDNDDSDTIFLLSLPRSGSTMLQTMLSAHSRIASAPEPHVLVPLYYAGYEPQLRTVDYDAINAALGLREFVKRLPNSQDNYHDACRAYAGTLYKAAMQYKPSARYFLDKTPPNVLVWPFLKSLFPKSKYIVLMRHPLAVLHSYAEAFFMGNYELAEREDPVLTRYVPLMASLLQDPDLNKHVVYYEKLVLEPETHIRNLLSFLDIDFEPSVLNCSAPEMAHGSMGDPINARIMHIPSRSQRHRWADAMTSDPSRRAMAERIVARLDPNDLATCGYPAHSLFEPLGAHAHSGAKARISVYHIKRRVYFILRNVSRIARLKKALIRIRYYCDLLLRDSSF